MPIYEYQCQSCGDRSEAIQKLSDPPLTTCENCGGALKKLLSAPAFQFKGSGWYVTDYANKSSGGKESEGGKENTKKEGDAKKEGGKGESGSGSSSKGSEGSTSKSDAGSKGNKATKA